MNLPKDISDAIDEAISASDAYLALQIKQLPTDLATKANNLVEDGLLSNIFRGQSVCDFCGTPAIVCRDVLDGSYYASYYSCNRHLSELLKDQS